VAIDIADRYDVAKTLGLVGDDCPLVSKPDRTDPGTFIRAGISPAWGSASRKMVSD
jgi:hypothetical protein